ncbi:MAG: RidA family protein, partial [Angustibacter sp.]
MIAERLAALGLQLPPAPAPLAGYLPAVRDGALVWTSGQLPMQAGELLATGRVGEQITTQRGAELARQCALNALAAIH